MKLITTFLFIIIFSAGLLCEPVFVLAGDTCYVDEDADDDGDGSDDEPYQDIEEALYKDCDKIIVEKGIYKDEITIGSDVEVEGKGRNDVIIAGKVTMKDGSELRSVTVADHGINIVDRASVKIENVKVKGANIGIETIGNGTLTVKDSVFYENRKAMYLQKGKNVKITNSEVYDNEEEGIDIRANVDGVISGNSIHNNGESGIEVIVGKSDLKIYDNKIKKNGSSGVAAQYYKSTSKIGGVKIKDNTISDNKSYGIDCKAPSGGNPGVEYWTESMQMMANKVYDNKKGDFSETCYFDTQKIDDATKTQKQQEQEILVKEEVRLKEQQIKDTQAKEIKDERDELEEKEKREKEIQDQLRQKMQIEKDLQKNAENLLVEISEIYAEDSLSQEQVESRSSLFMFFIGPDYKELRKIAEHISQYDKKIADMNMAKDQITDNMMRENVSSDIVTVANQRDLVYKFVQQYNDEFSFFGWFFRKRA